MELSLMAPPANLTLAWVVRELLARNLITITTHPKAPPEVKETSRVKEILEESALTQPITDQEVSTPDA